MNINEILAELKSGFGNAETTSKAVSPTGKLLSSELTKGLCFVVDDEPGVRHLIASVLKSMGLQVEEFGSVSGLMTGLARHHPKLIFLDISLEKSDAVEAVHGLAKLKYLGAVTLMSGRHGRLLDDIRKVGERKGLKMPPALLKPFEIAAIRKVVHDSFGQMPTQTRSSDAQKKVPISESMRR